MNGDTKPQLAVLEPELLRRKYAIEGATPPTDVLRALEAARAMGICSVWCRGLWVFNPGLWCWRAVPTPPPVGWPSPF